MPALFRKFASALRQAFVAMAGSLLIAPLAQAGTIEHAMGTTEVPDQPLRVVTLFQGATDSAVALGITPVGVVESWAQKPTYEYLRPALEGVELVGLETQPNLEIIQSLKPDLIIATKARHEEIYDLLSQIAPTVMAENVYDFEYSLDLTAAATGHEAEGAEVWDAFQTRIADFRTAITSEESQWPLSASVLNVRDDHLRLYLHESFGGAVLDEIGFTFPLPETEGWGIKLKTKEALPTVNADVFFIILHNDSDAVAQNYAAWSDHALWKALDAPRNGAVYEVDRVNWLLSGGVLGANLMLDELYGLYGVEEAMN